MSVSESTQDQFRSLLRLQSDAQWSRLLAGTEELLACAMPETARALVWQLRAEAHDHLGSNEQALAAYQRSFELCYLPSTALCLLGLYGLPSYPAEGGMELPWLTVARAMLRQGDAGLFFEVLQIELRRLPLQQQRRLWCSFLESEQGLDIRHAPNYQLRWSWMLSSLGVDLAEA